MVRSRSEAVAAAIASHTNIPGTCQKWTREIFQAPSVGDQDRDGDADAVDGWLSEPVAKRHYKDPVPPAGVPIAFSGGSRGFGHRAVSLGGGRVRSTDMSSAGHYLAGSVGTVTIKQIESSMNVKYLGWSETISGIQIPSNIKAPKVNTRVTKARDLLLEAQRRAEKKGLTKRANKIKAMLKVGPKS